MLVYVGEVLAKRAQEAAKLAAEVTLASTALKAELKLPLGHPTSKLLDDLIQVGRRGVGGLELCNPKGWVWECSALL